MQLIARIVDGCGDIKSFICHGLASLYFSDRLLATSQLFDAINIHNYYTDLFSLFQGIYT
jgi:hypothetical protein